MSRQRRNDKNQIDLGGLNMQEESDVTMLHEEPPPDKDDELVANSTSVMHKADLMMLNNGWNDKNERIVISIGENAASYKWMHEKSASICKLINQILSIILIVFTTGLSAETILPSVNESFALSMTRRIFTYIVTVISVLQNFLKYEQLSERHAASATAFSQLYHDIQQQMCMYRRDRHNATEYVSNTLKQFDTLVLNGNVITPYVLRQFKNTFKNSDISIPDIADRIQKIEIISEPRQDAGLGVVMNKSINVHQPKSQSNRYGRYGMCNLEDIHNAFQIHGDISDQDLQNADAVELRVLRKKFLAGKSDFEYQRYLQHMDETE